MKIGELKYRIQIQSHDGTTDPAGTLAESGWKEFWTCWAGKRDISGKEYLKAVEVGSDVTTEFSIRYKSGITSKMRISCNGLTYDISGVVDKTGNRTELILMAVRRDA